MPVNPEDFLSFARRAADMGGEISRRNAAGRAYYASFHACRRAATGVLGIPVDTGHHQRIIDAFESSRDHRYRGIGYMLRQHRALRHRADYDIDEEFGVAEMEQSLDHAAKILARVARLDS